MEKDKVINNESRQSSIENPHNQIGSNCFCPSLLRDFYLFVKTKAKPKTATKTSSDYQNVLLLFEQL